MRIAVQAHKGQTRKDGKTPYVEHPLGVAAILMEHGYDDEVVAAGLLHDVLEDTPITAPTLEAEVGHQVTRIVEGASEPDKTLSWHVRKQHTLDALPEKSLGTKRVIAADKLHNIRALAREVEARGEDAWTMFNSPKDAQEWYYGEIADTLATIDQPLFKTLKDAIDRLFNRQ